MVKTNPGKRVIKIMDGYFSRNKSCYCISSIELNNRFKKNSFSFQILKVSTNSLREMEVGKIVNLLSNDVARFDQVHTHADYK